MRKRTPANTYTKQQILDATIVLGKRRGIDRVYKRHIAAKLGCAMGTVNHHWSTIDALRKAVRRHASTTGDHTPVSGRLSIK